MSRGQRDPRALDASGWFDGVDVEKDVYAKYFVTQILDLDETSLWQAWSKVGAARRPLAHHLCPKTKPDGRPKPIGGPMLSTGESADR